MKRTIATRDGGRHVDLTPKEQEEKLKEWDKAAKDIKKRKKEEQEKANKKAEIRASIALKMSLTDEEIDKIINP